MNLESALHQVVILGVGCAQLGARRARRDPRKFWKTGPDVRVALLCSCVALDVMSSSCHVHGDDFNERSYRTCTGVRVA